MRIDDDPDSTVLRRHTGELHRHQHTALDVYMAIDKTGHQIGPLLPILWQFTTIHLSNAPVIHHQLAIENLAANHINDMSLICHHRLIVLRYIIPVVNKPSQVGCRFNFSAGR